MILAVTDANIFIDLIYLEMLGYLFNLDIEIHTTLEVHDQLNTNQKKIIQNFIQSKDLLVYSFSFEELTEIYSIDCPNGLELADRTIFYYAEKFNSIVLSGDIKLRKYCEKINIDVRGIIWVFDQLNEKKVLSAQVLASKMEELIQFNSRLPIEICQERIQKWKSK